jgi:hypothetical protein
MDQKGVESWVEGYVRAWNTNDPGEIGQLFSAEAIYYTGPFDEPWQGREAIITNWLNRKDEAGKFDFRYQVLAVTADLGIVRGWTRYVEPVREYSNLWLIRFDDQGRCAEFTEWWVERK